jgi:hypothetical protein
VLQRHVSRLAGLQSQREADEIGAVGIEVARLRIDRDIALLARLGDPFLQALQAGDGLVSRDVDGSRGGFRRALAGELRGRAESLDRLA